MAKTSSKTEAGKAARGIRWGGSLGCGVWSALIRRLRGGLPMALPIQQQLRGDALHDAGPASGVFDDLGLADVLPVTTDLVESDLVEDTIH